MAEEKKAAKQYDSIIDAFLADREPDWKELGMEDAKESGDNWMERTHKDVDTDFEDEIAESASRHTPIWGPKSGAKGEILDARLTDKEKAQPRVNAVKADWRKDARRDNDAYKSEHGDNDSLMDEVTMDIARAGKEGDLAPNSADKKEVSDEEVLKYVRDLLNQGKGPAKVAELLAKRAELELFNHQMATDYLQRNAGLIGMAYLEPNTYMDKTAPNYERTAGKKVDLGGAACVAQKRAWDAAGIKPQAKAVKQVSACEGCEYFNKDARGKTCNLYHLPVVGSTQELTQIVNHLTPGVPTTQKHAALVVLANGDDKRVQNVKVAEQTNIVKTADAKVRNQEKRASYEYADVREVSKHFESDHVAKMHQKGASLEKIYNWASEKFGDVDASIAFRGFVQSLKKNAKGKVVIAAADLKFLNRLGIRNESYVGSAKCASCPAHYGREGLSRTASAIEVEQDRGAQRVDQKFAARTTDVVRSIFEDKKEASIVVTASKVRTLHQAGHSIAKIYNGAANKVGSVEARKAVAGFIEEMKKHPGKVAVSESDRAFLVGKLGFKPESVRMLDPQRRPVTQVVASVPDDSHVLGYPGMEKHAGEKKATDGYTILAEYDLTGSHDMQDIEPAAKYEDIEMGGTMTAGDID